jgi:DNA-directed RNA polymerase subunit RPC12/RpoP
MVKVVTPDGYIVEAETSKEVKEVLEVILSYQMMYNGIELNVTAIEGIEDDDYIECQNCGFNDQLDLVRGTIVKCNHCNYEWDMSKE